MSTTNHIDMKKMVITALLAALVSISAGAQSNLKKIYDEQIDPVEQIDKAIAKARKEGKHVVCQVGGNWCRWCLMFADFITKDAEINKMINDNFVYIHVNYNPRKPAEGDKAQQTEAMLKKLGKPTRFGYPVMVVLDANGKVIHYQDSSFLEQDNGYNRDKVIRFFKNWTPKAVKG